MRTFSVRLDDDIRACLEGLALTHGLNQSQLMREAITDKLEELEDAYLLRMRMAEPFTPIADDEVWKRLGLADRTVED